MKVDWITHPERSQIKEKLLSLIEPVSESGCWLWMGVMKSRRYGSFIFEGKHHSVHRVAYEVFTGKPLRRLTVDHLCGVTICVNPDHLEAIPWKAHAKRNMKVKG